MVRLLSIIVILQGLLILRGEKKDRLKRASKRAIATSLHRGGRMLITDLLLI